MSVTTTENTNSVDRKYKDKQSVLSRLLQTEKETKQHSNTL